MKENTQILGAAIEPVLKAFLSEAFAAKILKEGMGIETLSTKAYYSANKYIKTLAMIQEKMGDALLKKVGQNVMGSANFPPNITNIEEALASIDVAYHMNHRPSDDDIGQYKFEKISNSEFTITCDNPYPCAFDYGIVMGVAKKFAPQAIVLHEKDSCRSKNESSCVYSIKIFN